MTTFGSRVFAGIALMSPPLLDGLLPETVPKRRLYLECSLGRRSSKTGFASSALQRARCGEIRANEK
jgi:hypothetical protein